MLILRSALFNMGLALATFMASFASLFIWVLPFPQRYRILNFWSRFILWWLKVICHLDYQIEGIENIPKDTAIVLCKHQSTWETIALQQIFPRQVWVLKRELFWIPFFGWAMALLRPIAINRGKAREARQQLLTQGIASLQEGHWVVIFPEGTRVVPGQTKPYRMGGALLAEAAKNYPVVPVAHNAGYFWNQQNFIKRPGTIKLKIGTPIDPQGKSAKEINALVEDWIEAAWPALGKPSD
ncbi:lysophospholipid acyltransferase family protein [Candidatus Venteria ishoeyi]|uniref:1-acyl-sn-glycerol-3-phosphate acyltransferase n=1 Tax=Candidatus Venteria ishoeyi TaxID=1899563 RepID=A0A1H6FG98_9GAMM|nr:lysophospholipid acyltransferase family protein [Candidatus Venteria ishoeyi]MDM8546869.1 lysophospholipid acyltransferase family protein [Candidatus Venteria ishoeyi]SEH08683.1 1-acyl-sn-glycerol-3-phosphate acyltransferase [Candidatus Venteria ishoeyi]